MSFYVSTATFFLLHCDEWDRVVALPRHKFVTGATLLQLEDTNGVIRIRKSKNDRKHNGKKKKVKITNTHITCTCIRRGRFFLCLQFSKERKMTNNCFNFINTKIIYVVTM